MKSGLKGEGMGVGVGMGVGGHTDSGDSMAGASVVQDEHVHMRAVVAMFEHYDADHDGALTVSELLPLLRELGVIEAGGSAAAEDGMMDTLLAEVAHAQIDLSSDGSVSVAEFKAWWARTARGVAPPKWIALVQADAAAEPEQLTTANAKPASTSTTTPTGSMSTDTKKSSACALV